MACVGRLGWTASFRLWTHTRQYPKQIFDVFWWRWFVTDFLLKLWVLIVVFNLKFVYQNNVINVRGDPIQRLMLVLYCLWYVLVNIWLILVTFQDAVVLVIVCFMYVVCLAQYFVIQKNAHPSLVCGILRGGRSCHFFLQIITFHLHPFLLTFPYLLWHVTCNWQSFSIDCV